MTDLADLSPEELDRLACKAVGIKPWHVEYRAVRVSSGAPHLFAADEWLRCEQELWTDVETLYRWHMVSQEPAACAMLKAAARAAGLTIVIEFHLGENVDAWVSPDPVEHLGFSESAETEERAFAEAVLSWAQAKGE